MNIPGFTAAKSLYRSRGHYYGRSADSPADTVVPAAPMCGPNCDAVLERCAQGLTKGMICGLCANCVTYPHPSGSDDPFGAFGPLWDFDDPRVPPILRNW